MEDYHVIAKCEIHDMMTFMLDHLPPTLHVVLLTRSEPPLPLARWPARDELYAVQADDLRFTPEETLTFLQQPLAFPLTPAAMQQLEAHVEGWAAGLRLITLEAIELCRARCTLLPKPLQPAQTVHTL